MDSFEPMARYLFWYLIKGLLFFVLWSLTLAILGLSVGFRNLYLNVLLYIFEFGRKRIQKAEEKKQRERHSDEESDSETYDTISDTTSSRAESESEISTAHEMQLKISDDKEPKDFDLTDIMTLITRGIETIVDDEVTKRFAAEELMSWNLLTRTNKNYHHISMRLTILWGIGCLIRYVILMPTRVTITVIGVTWLILCTAIIGCIPEGPFKRWLYWNASILSFRILSRAFSGIITFHDRQYMARGGGITVANHTSPIDVAILAYDNCYALVGQRQGGFLGVLQTALGRAASHIWFERFEIKDRELVLRRLSEHVNDPNKLPILIFPEGTCINNSAVMMFKKGSFEVGGTVYPVAIKYDPRFGDPFWNSSRNGYMSYLLRMMTSWAIVCNVYYLPPMTRQDNESAIDFANRVKAEIAKRGGLVDLQWDGQLKRIRAKDEFKQREQHKYSKRIKHD